MARFRCSECGFVYDEGEGCQHEGFPPGTRWADIPRDWACPDCAVVEKPEFEPLDAGSADEDQQANRPRSNE